MTQLNKYLGKAGLLSFLLVAFVAVSSVNAFAMDRNTKNRVKPSAAKTMKPKSKTSAAPAKPRPIKKKRRHARRSKKASVKKS